MAVPIGVGMLFQTLYLLVDLYFVAGLGDAAIAGVSSAGTVGFVILALTQMLGVGTVALVSQAVGRKDQSGANLIFNQSVLLSAICGGLTLVAGFLGSGPYVRWVAADPAAAAAGIAYLYWYTPGLALQFALVAMGSALRGTGIVKPTMMVQMLTVILNTVLAPVLISGWGTHHPLGAAGAGLASSIAIGCGVVFLWVYFARLEHYVALHRQLWAPRWSVIRCILNVGLPAGGEFFMLFVILGAVYWVIRGFGPAAQAGFGIGGRVMQGLFLPVMAVAFAVAPVAGQNFGAHQHARVRETFRTAAILSSLLMLAITLVCQWHPEWFIEGFSTRQAPGGRDRRCLPAHHFLELRCDRAHLHLLRPVPGTRQHLALAPELGIAVADVRAAGGAAVALTAFHAHPGVVPVGGDRDAAGGNESRAAAVAITRAARRAAGADRQRSPRRCSAGRLGERPRLNARAGASGRARA